MNLKCLFGHKWNGCKCANCGKTRDRDHTWENVNGKCEKRCTICGRIEIIPHTFKKVDLKCEERCVNCGETHKILHVFQNGVCVGCGIRRDMMGSPEYVKVTESIPSDNISLAQFIVKVASDFAGKGDWELLEPACRRYAEGFSCIVEELDAAKVVANGWGWYAPNLAIRRYLDLRIAKGNFNLKNANEELAKAGRAMRPGQIHPGVVYDFVIKKLTPYLVESSRNTLELLPNMQSEDACNALTELVLHTKEKPRSTAALVSWLYDQAVDFVKHTMQKQ